MNILLALLVFLVRSSIRTGLRCSALTAHLGEFPDVQRSLRDNLDDGTSRWRKGITELVHPTEDAEDSGRDDFGRLGHRCSGQFAVPRVYSIRPSDFQHWASVRASNPSNMSRSYKWQRWTYLRVPQQLGLGNG